MLEAVAASEALLSRDNAIRAGHQSSRDVALHSLLLCGDKVAVRHIE